MSAKGAVAIGIDLGTPAVAVVLADADGGPHGVEERLNPRQPRPFRSEDDADGRWDGVVSALGRLAVAIPDLVAGVDAIGLSGQMHGALLLDAADPPVRPAMLCNDGRSTAEAGALARRDDDLASRLDVRPMPGFTGPKIAWLHRHEPETLARTHHLLLAKDSIRLKLTGERITAVNDAAGTWLFDQGRRDWSPETLGACGVDPAWLPGLVESDPVAGRLRSEWATRWGLRRGLSIASGGAIPRSAASARSTTAPASCRPAPRPRCSSPPQPSRPVRTRRSMPPATPSLGAGTTWRRCSTGRTP